MAQHKSAKKRARSDLLKRDRNKSYLSSVRTAVKSFRNAAAAGDKSDNIDGLFKTAQTLLSRAASKGVLHRNNASRKVARLAAVLRKAKDGTYTPIEKPKKKRR